MLGCMTVLQYNSTFECDREALDTVIKRALHHAKVSRSLENFGVLSLDCNHNPYLYTYKTHCMSTELYIKGVFIFLSYLQYKAGLSSKGSSPSHPPVSSFSTFADNTDVDVSGAWLELTLLCQSYGHHQQGASTD